MTEPVPVALAVHRGYELHVKDGKPYVIRRWKTHRKGAKGDYFHEKHVALLALDLDQFPSGPMGTEAFNELSAAWREWTSWNKDNKECRP